MPAHAFYKSLPLLIGLLVSGCAVYDNYGFGRVAAVVPGKVDVTPVTLPPQAPSISQRFRPEGVSAKSEHKGFDILVPSGTPVLAAAEGTVSEVETSILYGRQIMIDHALTAGGIAIQTRYFHLSERRVSVGERVRRGQLIAYSGLSGMAGMFPHLHFEVHRLVGEQAPIASGFIDPQLFWVDGPGRVSCFDSRRDWPRQPVMLTYPVPCQGLPWS